MTTSEYKFDVAFSFLADDEEIAISINDLIKDGLTTFIYSERQKELAGTDGEKTFNLVFGSEARIVFVLYRNGWGETSWTRIEETAIRNRGYDEGYDFVLFAPLEKNSELPKWLPKNRIWIGLDRWGIEGAASVIEARVQEAGGSPKEETIEDRINRLRNEIDAEKDKKQFLDSSEGVKFASDEASKLFGIFEQAINNTNNSATSVKLNISVGVKECVLYGDRFSIRFKWSVSYTNSQRDSVLYMDLFDGSISLGGESSFPSSAPKRIKNMEFQFDVSKSRKPLWKESRSPKQSYSSEGLSKFALTLLLDKILESKRKQN